MPATTVATPATDRRLCTIPALKAELGIAADDETEDEWLEAECLSASDRVAEACGVAGDDAGDAPATLAEEVAEITFAPGEIPARDVLEMPWRFPARVVSIKVGGAPLDPALYRAEPKGAVVHRQDSRGNPVAWDRAATVVTVKSGWPAASIPTVLQDAVRRLVRLRWEARDRDLSVKAEETDGAFRQEWHAWATGSGMPSDIRQSLVAAGYIVPTIA